MRFLFFILLSMNLYAHQTSLSLLNMEVQETKIVGSYKIAVKDVQTLFNLDNNFDNKVTWKELQVYEQKLSNTIKSHFSVNINEKTCPLKMKSMQLDILNSNTYVHFGFEAECQEKVERLEVAYSLLFDKDSLHKAYVKVLNNDSTHTRLFSENKLKVSFDLKEPSLWHTFTEFVEQGIIHIFIGIDHILFLVALLLPSVLFMREKKWEVNNSFKQTLLNVLKIVTAFTVAHSITLTLTILGFISLSSWLVESFIAFSVILAGLNNIRGTIEKRLWILVFVFGLIHGMGFASVLMDLELQESSLVTALLGFNLGVELGQVTIVMFLVPLIYALRKYKWYVPMVLYFGSALIMLMGLIWLFERVSF